MLVVLLLSQLLSPVAHASPTAPKRFAVDMEVTRGGKAVVSRQNLALLEGEDGEVTENKNFVDVVAKEELPGKGVRLDLAVGTIDAKGNKIVEARPSVIAMENQPASVTTQEKGKGSVSVSVTARPEN